MSILSWNCRRLGNPRTVQALKGLVDEVKPDIIFLMETLCNRNKLEPIKKAFNFDGLFYVDCKGGSGGLALFWKNKNKIKLLSFSFYFIDVEINLDGGGLWRFTGFYGNPNRS